MVGFGRGGSGRGRVGLGRGSNGIGWIGRPVVRGAVMERYGTEGAPCSPGNGGGGGVVAWGKER